MFFKIISNLFLLTILFQTFTCKKSRKEQELSIYYEILRSEEEEVSSIDLVGVLKVGKITFLTPNKDSIPYAYVILDNSILYENMDVVSLYQYGEDYQLFTKALSLIDSLEAINLTPYSVSREDKLGEALLVCTKNKKTKSITGCDEYIFNAGRWIAHTRPRL